MGSKNKTVGKREAAGVGSVMTPGEWGGNYGGREASGVGPDPHGVEWEEGGREASGVEKNPGRVRQGVEGGVESSPDDSTRHGEGRGVELSRDDSTPNGGGGLSHGRMTRPNKMEEGSSRQGTIRPSEGAGIPRETKPWEPHQLNCICG